MPAKGFDELVEGRPLEVAALFHRFIDAVGECGPFRGEAARNGSLVLHGGTRIFGSVRATSRGLRGFLNLDHRVDDPRFTAIEPLTTRLFFHRFVVTSAEQLDNRFLDWLREAYAVGQGKPV
jgi:hypothetical protein